MKDRVKEDIWDVRIQSNVTEKRKNGDGCFNYTSVPSQEKLALAKKAQPLLNPRTYRQS